ncbi:MAG: tyrosine-type recombinase/integrase [Alphaproteobacteria bacterium]
MKNKDKKRDKYNPQNERMKYKYRVHLRRALKRDDKTITALLKHIREYEIFMDFAGFEKFNDHVADKYISHLTNGRLSLSFINDNIRALRNFLGWLERQRGYKSKLNYNHIDYLNLTNNQRNTAKASEYKKAYKLEQILETIRAMPEKTDKNKRDKAMISLQALCGLRIDELRAVKLKSIIEEDGQYFVYVSPKDMGVKFAKTRHAFFLPLPIDITDNVISWRDYLLRLGFTLNDPLFPKINSRFATNNLFETKIVQEGIASNTTIRDVFKKAFTSMGYEYLRPHSFRHTWARYVERQSPAFLNTVRQCLGHDSIDTTLNSYGQSSLADQRYAITQTKTEFD